MHGVAIHTQAPPSGLQRPQHPSRSPCQAYLQQCALVFGIALVLPAPCPVSLGSLDDPTASLLPDLSTAAPQAFATAQASAMLAPINNLPLSYLLLLFGLASAQLTTTPLLAFVLH